MGRSTLTASALSLVLLLTMLFVSHPRRCTAHADFGDRKLSEDVEPRGMHIALDGSDAIRVMWKTNAETTDATTCSFGYTNTTLNFAAVGSSYSYQDGGFSGKLHEVVLSSLKPTQELFYRCGSEQGWSPVYAYSRQPASLSSAGKAWIGVIGDMGIHESEYTIASLERSVQESEVQLLVHVGDISYANNYKPSTNNSWVWDTYMDKLQPMVTKVPYMTAPGNHEAQFNFAAYLNWLHMPFKASGSQSPFYYSFDYLGVHFTMFSTEHDFTPGSEQHMWMEKDLEVAAKNRKNVPWIVVVGHRPLYCSSVAVIDRCTKEAPVFRHNIESMLNTYGVDVYICGHNHQYERSYPVYNMTVVSHSYQKPMAPVYIVDGAAGDLEHVDPTFLPEKEVPWRAEHGHLWETSWLKMLPSATSLQIELIRSSTGEAQDHFTITK